MKSYLSGIHHLSIAADLRDPHLYAMARLHYMYALETVLISHHYSLKTSSAYYSGSPLGAWLLPPSQASALDNHMLWAAALLGFWVSSLWRIHNTISQHL